MLEQAPEYFRSLAPQMGDWASIALESALGAWALCVLMIEAFRGRRQIGFSLAAPLMIVLLVFSLRSAFAMGSGELVTQFGGMIEQSRQTELLRSFFLLCGVLVCQIGGVTLRRQKLARAEFDVLVMIAVAGLMFLAQCRHFALLFVALEMMSISMYVLVAYIRHSASSLEAALKYLVQSGLSSALLLMGIVLLYGVAGNPALVGAVDDPFAFDQLRSFIALNADNAYVLGGAMLVLAGLLFKVAAVPFQIWVADVYQGAPTAVTAFLGVASKAAGFVLLINVLAVPFAPLKSVTLPLLSVLAVATMLFGNFAALGQRNVKRLMGMSGIAHAGYMLMGVCAAVAGVAWAPTAVYFYLFAYLLASFTLFAVMSIVSGEDDSLQDISDYAGLLKRDNFLGGVLVVALGSLAGIPPMAGFVAKLLLFIAAVKAGLYTVLGAALLGVVISIYYYFGWMRTAVFESASPGADDEEAEGGPAPLPQLCFWMRTTLTTLAILTVGMGFWQGFLTL